MKKIVVKKDDVRLDVFLSDELNISRSKIQDKINNGLITVNNNVATKNGIKLFTNDVVSINDEPLVAVEDNKNNSFKPFDFKLKIVYEDDYLLIVYKPSGMLTHPTKYQEENTLLNALTNYLNTNFFLVHRIDKDTSGLVLIAKDEKVYQQLLKMFENRMITKKYYALVHNRFNIDHFIIDIPIGRSKDNHLKMSTSRNSKNAKNSISEVNVIKNYQHHALVDVNLKTGRTHQIRVHLKHINHPIVNDPLYGIEKQTTNYGQCLIAYYISFIHPKTNCLIEQKIDLDEEFKYIIKTIENK